MAANRQSIFQPHSFTPSINNCVAVALRFSKTPDAVGRSGSFAVPEYVFKK